VLISVPEAFEPVSGYTTGSVMHGQCDPISNVPSKLYAHAAASAPQNVSLHWPPGSVQPPHVS